MPNCPICGGRGGKYTLTRTGARHWIKCACLKALNLTPAQIELLKNPNAPSSPQLAMPITDQKGEHMARRNTRDDDDGGSRRRRSSATETRRRSPNGRARTRREEYSEDPGWGSLFHRPDNEGNQPAYTGQGLDIDGNPVELAIWIRKSRAGTKYLRIHIQEPYEADDAGGDLDDDEDEQPRAKRGRARARDVEEDDDDQADDDDEDDVPF